MIFGMDPLVLLAFVPASLALNFTPGPDMLFCVGQGLRGGPRAAAAASLGISTGAMVHVTLAGLGLGALVALHPGLFGLIRWIGVAYLLRIAWTTLNAPPGRHHVAAAVSSRTAFRQAILVNLTNPKVILFVLAFIPQFVDPGAGSVLGQFLVFGLVLSTGGFIVTAGAGMLAGGAGRTLMGSARFERWVNRVSATIFGVLALRLACMRQG